MTGRLEHQIISGFVAITILSSFSDCEYCPASAPTVSVVSNCPTTKTEWEDAASRKKCNYMSAKCGGKAPVYHCLLNQWRNETVEVCASTWYISGFCAVYNIDEMKVIDDFKTDCTKFTEGTCPTRYLSSEAYLYQMCYEKRDLAVTLTDTTRQETNDRTSYVAALAVVMFLAIIMGISLVLTCLGKIPIIGRCVQFCKKNTDEESTSCESAPLMESTGNAQSEAQNTTVEGNAQPEAQNTTVEGIITESVDTHNSTNVPYSELKEKWERTSSSRNADSDGKTKNNAQNKDIITGAVDTHNSTNIPYSGPLKNEERASFSGNADSDEETESNEQIDGIITGTVDTHNSTNIPYSGPLKNEERPSSSSNADSDEETESNEQTEDSDEETESNEQTEEETKHDGDDVSQQDGLDVSQQDGVNVSQQDGVNVSQQDGADVDVSQQDGVHVFDQGGADVDVSQQDGVYVSDQDGVDVSHQTGVNVLQQRLKFEGLIRSFPS